MQALIWFHKSFIILRRHTHIHICMWHSMVSTLRCRDRVATNLTCHKHTDFNLIQLSYIKYQILLFSGLWAYMVPEAIPETKLVGLHVVEK